MARTNRIYKDTSYSARLNKKARNKAVRRIPVSVDTDTDTDPRLVLRSRQAGSYPFRW